jgi:hypothetical protein
MTGQDKATQHETRPQDNTRQRGEAGQDKARRRRKRLKFNVLLILLLHLLCHTKNNQQSTPSTLNTNRAFIKIKREDE